MANQSDQARNKAFLASESDPQTRSEVARGVVFECRRITFRQMAAASRSHDTKRVTELKAVQDTYDDELREISKENTQVINRALTHHVRFLEENGQKIKFSPQSNLKDGPR